MRRHGQAALNPTLGGPKRGELFETSCGEPCRRLPMPHARRRACRELARCCLVRGPGRRRARGLPSLLSASCVRECAVRCAGSFHQNPEETVTTYGWRGAHLW